ncbi:MAG: glycosyltransferase [Vicingus serpentipes]|nr:glycosyltransferase [Vicingus serpentipes]
MSVKPLISIITINFNDKVGLERTFKSVFNQTYQGFEYLVIDGGSTDGSREAIENNKDKIDYYLSEADNGVYNAMNKGIKKATGEYLLFLNSGDELYDSKVLEEHYKDLHTEELIYFDIFRIFEDKTDTYKFPYPLNYKVFLEGTIGHPTTFIKRNLFEKYGYYDETLKIVSDWKFFSLAILKHNCSFKKVDAILSKFYMNGMSTINQEVTASERNKVIAQYFPEYRRLYELENLMTNLKKSRLIKLLNYIGFLKAIKKIQ